MKITCKNCHNTFKGKYCNNCGQTADTNKLDFHFLWLEIKGFLIKINEGILYSAKELFTRPGHSIREFVEGRRIKHSKPLSMVVVLATIYGFLYHYFHIDLMHSLSTRNSSLELVDYNDFASTHYAWITLASIPFYTLGTYISFLKQKYNFVEYFTMNTYKASQRLIFHIVTFPFLYFFNGTPYFSKFIFTLYITDLILIFWTNFQFFNKLSKMKILLLTILSHVIFLTSFTLVIEIILLARNAFEN